MILLQLQFSTKSVGAFLSSQYDFRYELSHLSIPRGMLVAMPVSPALWKAKHIPLGWGGTIILGINPERIKPHYSTGGLTFFELSPLSYAYNMLKGLNIYDIQK